MNVRLGRNGCTSRYVSQAQCGRPSISVPGLGRVSSSDEGLAELILRVGPSEFFGRAILERPVRPTLVILTPPGLDPVVSLPQ